MRDGEAPPPFTRKLPNAAPGSPRNWALYDRFLDLCERFRWKMADVRREIATVAPARLTDDDQRVLDCLADIALVEGNAPSIVVNQLAVMINDAEFASWATYQVGEEQKHFHAIRHYLRHVGHPLAAQHDEASYVSHQKGFLPQDFQDEHGCILINLFGMARDERRHLQWFIEYFEMRSAENVAFVPNALQVLKRLLELDRGPRQDPQRHQGSGVDSYRSAADKLLRNGYSFEVVARAVREQWALLERLFGATLDIQRRQFLARQMARPTAV